MVKCKKAQKGQKQNHFCLFKQNFLPSFSSNISERPFSFSEHNWLISYSEFLLLGEKLKMVQNQLAKCGRKLSLGVSICLDVVSIKTLELNIFKSQPQPLRLSRQSKKVGLNCWNFLGNFKSQVLIILIPESLNFQHSHHWEFQSRQFQTVGLNSWEILDSFKKLASTCREISILILIGLDSRDPQAYRKYTLCETFPLKLIQAMKTSQKAFYINYTDNSRFFCFLLTLISFLFHSVCLYFTH